MLIGQPLFTLEVLSFRGKKNYHKNKTEEKAIGL